MCLRISNTNIYLSLDQNVTHSNESSKCLDMNVDMRVIQSRTPVKIPAVIKEIDLKVDKKEEEGVKVEKNQNVHCENDRFTVVFTCSTLMTLLIVIILYYRHK